MINITKLVERMELAKAEGRQADLERMHKIYVQACVVNCMVSGGTL